MRKKHILASTLALAAVYSCNAGAQTITAGVNGTVTDASGAVIPNAKVTATNVGTNVSITQTTTKDGVYVIRNLQVGDYKLTVESAGFATQTLGPFTLETGQEAKLDSKLGVEGSNTNIQVSSDVAPLLNTENATLGSTLDTNAIQNMPLVGRNFTELTLYVPGAVTGSPASFTGSAAAIERNGNGTLASQNGNRQEANNFLLEGIDINETINNQLGYNPSADAIGQVRVISANANAEFGNVGGGDIITLLKSGTNAFHGSAFMNLSNYNMDANTYANKHQASAASFVPITPYTQTIFGGTFGGRIIKDKLFFFVDYEGRRYHSAGVGLGSVATQKMRAGDFSELLAPSLNGGKTIQLYNTQVAGQPAYVNNQLGAATNPVAQYLYAHPEYYPLPNHAPTPGGLITQNNYQAPTKTNRYDDQFDIKVNYTLSQRDNFSGSYSHALAGDYTTPVLGITFPGSTVLPFQSFSFDEVHQFSPRLINDYNMGFSRVVVLGANTSDPTGHFGMNGNSIVGLGSIPQPQNGFTQQSFTGNNTGGLTNLGNLSTGTTYIDNTFSYTDTLTYQLARHTIKGGVQILRYQQNTFYPGNDGALGHFDYSGQFTAQAGTSGGFSLADFNLNRIYQRAIGGVTGLAGQRQFRNSAFIQDDWKASPNLTLNLGLRWEYDQPILEVNNKQANINVATKKVLLAGVNGNSRALYDGVWTNFMPRLGFAWNVTPKTVLRGGYGITTFFEGTGANLRLNFNYPFQNGFTAAAAVPTATSAGTPYTTSQGFGTSNTSCDITTSTTPCTTTIRAWDQKIKPMFLQEFSLTAEYQVSKTASLTVGYLGETGQHLVTAGAGNALAAPCYINGVATDPNNAALATACPAPYVNLVGQTGSVVFTNSNAMENYNSLQATYRQRLSKGLELTANYTWAKALTNSTGFFGAQGINGQSAYAQNYYDNHAEYGPTAQDVRHNINGHMNYALPFGRGRMLGANMNRAFDEVVGGWHVAMSAIVYTGFPVNMGASLVSFTKNNSERANYYRAITHTNRTANNWFGTDASAVPCTPSNSPATSHGYDNGVCAYGQPLNGTFGTARVDSERAPGYQSADASVYKDFSITESQHVSFRADAANVFNITSLGNPTNNTQSAAFGQITSARSQARQMQLSAKYVF
ncbi:Carboxypeptidase regulatory-like domain-containing protein [Terriglobus roseus]|uniref:Carboxypeptidase regulatory-like domain-containing protein n=1 Tax=Terriglobus roseus TaxID=392734 RepID=A0A1H4LIL1_9BACT|nr:Carboxypeptidase regulatory-like domain-containing protein [Terriglobus roseus]